MKTLIASAAAMGFAVAMVVAAVPVSAASPSVEQCSNGLFNKNHPDLCKGVSPSDAYGQNDGDTAAPGKSSVQPG